MNETMSKLIEFLRNTSPFLWQMSLRQVYLSAFGYIVFSLLLAYLARLCWKKASASGKENKVKDSYYISLTDLEWDKRVLRECISIFSVALWFSSAILAYLGAVRFMNPEYYAIQIILSNFGGR